MEKPHPRTGLVRFTAEAPPLSITWRHDTRVSNVIGVYPHPARSQFIVLAAADGLHVSEDGGLEWKPLAGAAAADIGVCSDIKFSIRNPDEFFVASRSKGVWRTRDAGKTFQQIGSRVTGLPHDSVVSLELSAADRGGRTILASHGEAAAGLSRSLDGGSTWSTLFPNQHLFRVHTGSSQGVCIVAAPTATPDSQRLYLAPSLTEPWQEMARDVICTGFATPLHRDGWILVSTADRGLLRIAHSGGIVRDVAPKGVEEWASVGFTWGANQDAQLIYAFAPSTLGAVVIDPASTRPVDTGGGQVPVKFQAVGQGLPRPSMVREGAHIRASASGQRFYAAINSLLYVGQRRQGPFAFTRAEVDPLVRAPAGEGEAAVIAAVSDQLRTFSGEPDLNQATNDLSRVFAERQEALATRQLALTVTLETPDAPPAAVSADLSRLGLSPRQLLRPAAPNQFTLRFPADLSRLPRPQDDWRRGGVGLNAFTVSAIHRSGEVASLVVPFIITESGAVTISFAEHIAMERGKPTHIAEQQGGRKRRNLPGFASPRAPWQVALYGGGVFDVSSFEVLSLVLRTRSESSQELFVQLRDKPSYDYPHVTQPLPLLKSGLVPEGKFTGKLQRINIPLSRLLEGESAFQPSITRAVVLSGEGGERTEYLVHEARFYPSDEDLPAEDAE
jgi:hypothetical protein